MTSWHKVTESHSGTEDELDDHAWVNVSIFSTVEIHNKESSSPELGSEAQIKTFLKCKEETKAGTACPPWRSEEACPLAAAQRLCVSLLFVFCLPVTSLVLFSISLLLFQEGRIY